jgi:hypothetical protein
MFCPVCKAEYRQGFTTCADCEVALVPALPGEEQARDPRLVKGRLEPLWEGEDLALHASLLEALDAAKIPYFNKPLSIYPGVRRADPFPVQPLTLFGYKVAVLSSDLPRAQSILEKLLQEEPKGELELPETLQPAQVAKRAAADADEAATAEIWRGADEEFSRFLQDALRENEMPSRAESPGGESVIFVRPSDVALAQEIVRQLQEASPPQ